MKDTQNVRRLGAWRAAGLLVATTVAFAPGARAQGGFGSTTDPRVGLRGGLNDAASAIENLELISHSPKADSLNTGPLGGLTFANSDMAFHQNYLVQSNFSGFQIWDIADASHPVLRKTYICATDQGDPTIYGHLLFLSVETTRGRTDCGTQGVADTVSKERARGVRIFDISDINHPRHITDVQTCRGSHTHTLVPDPHDKSVVYLYVSGSAPVRPAAELPGCSGLAPDQDPKSELFRIEVIRVPLAHPERARVVSKPAILANLGAVTKHADNAADIAAQQARMAASGRAGHAGGGPAQPLRGPVQCHDITVYPAIGLAGGACGGYGVLLNITNPAHPTRLAAVADSNFAFWHSATFNNDGSTLLFTDEWGGGTQPKCRATDPIDWGGDAIFTLKHDKLTPAAYFKMPAVQTSTENCVAHNGSLIPVPGRDIMAQGWYQGGMDVIDFTDAHHPKEIAYFDRGPIDSTKLVIGGYWAAYWYNGHIYSSEIVRGLDVFDLKPSDQLSQNEIDAAKLVHLDEFNPQSQPKFKWPAAFPVVRSYLDQLVRNNGLASDRTAKIAESLDVAERLSGVKQRAALNKVAAALNADARKAKDAAKVRVMAAAVRDLAKAAR